ncbi:hypothetical protein BDR06DRAFT_952049 [Suillus hirtellus]|nr:hypothetical protein BDR06DRAFT_952049 [Suillus hirtellus]
MGTPLDRLQIYGDYAVTLMKRFRDLSSLLDKHPSSHSDGTPGVDAETEETRYRRLVENWNGTVEEIRKIEGFSRRLFSPLFSDLQHAWWAHHRAHRKHHRWITRSVALEKSNYH